MKKFSYLCHKCVELGVVNLRVVPTRNYIVLEHYCFTCGEIEIIKLDPFNPEHQTPKTRKAFLKQIKRKIAEV